MESKNQSLSIGKYIYSRPHIGKGSFSKVYRGLNVETKEIVAIKKIEVKLLKKTAADKITKEVELISSFNHENIVHLEEVLQDDHFIYIITEYCAGSLKDIINRPMSEEEIKHYMIQIKNGMEYLYSMNVIHRDLKPQNILITYKDPKKITGDYREITVKIADFGFARNYEDENFMFETLLGSPLYLSYEILVDKKYTISSDLWSIGVIFYELLFKSLPFGKPLTILELIKSMETKKIMIPKNHSYSKECIELLFNLLQKDVKNRIKWVDFFKHPFLEEENIIDSESDIDTSDGSDLDNLNVHKNEGDSFLLSTEIDKSSLAGQLVNIMNRGKIESKPIIKNEKIMIIDDYISTSLPTINISIPISQPINIPPRSNSIITTYGSYKSTPDSILHSYTISPSDGAISIANSIYKFMATSIDNLKTMLPFNDFQKK